MNERLDGLSVEIRDAENRLLKAMQEEYPLDCTVLINHARGCFEAKVIGYDLTGHRIIVMNPSTDKESKWWYRDVEKLKEARGEGNDW